VNLIASYRQRFADLSLARKFLVLCSLLVIGVIALTAAAVRMHYNEAVQERRDGLQAQVQMGIEVLQTYADRVKDGELTEDKARQAAIRTLHAMQTNQGADYYFLLDERLRMVEHPTVEQGSDMSEYKNSLGEYVYRDVSQAASKGDGFASYSVPKPGTTVPLPKLTYARTFPQWGWTLGRGVFIDDITAKAKRFTIGLALVGALMVVAVVLLCWLISRAIGRPLQAATRNAEAIAAGDLSHDIHVASKDESGRLLLSMQQMQGQLRRFKGEMTTLIQKQAGEDISHRMPEDFPGDYGALARGVNTALFEHLDAIGEAMTVMDEYGNGNLARDMRRLPGQRAALHEALDVVKANLTAVNADISRLAAAAAHGDFSARGEVSRYAYAFKEMVLALNSLMEQADAGLADVGRVMTSISEGDLTAHVGRHYDGAFGVLASAANQTSARLSEIVRHIQQSAEAINTAAAEISVGNADLSVRTEQQAASLEETAASMEELTSTVRHNAENARRASALASEAGGVAQSGGQVVQQVVETMQAISASSSRITDIIGVIDGIAFQTNILALNAAVEAARAGEQGRGFAVVASEVRMLAQRSGAAAKEIKDLITESSDKVELGSQLTSRAGETMKDIVSSVGRVTGLMGEISVASNEQSAGIEQVAKTVAQLDDTTQQNAALVEESSAAAQSLEQQAGDLMASISVFRLNDTRQVAKRVERRIALA
jgi:methyl-accepting chemotaxis protein